MIAIAVYQHLKASPGVMVLTRAIFPHVIPEEREAPAITYSLDADDRERLLDGEGEYRLALVAIDTYSESYNNSHDIAKAVESSLIDFRGQLGTVTPIIDADHIRLDRKFDIFETATKLNRVSLQFTIGYETG